MNAWELYQQRYGTIINQSQIINWTWYDTLTYTSATTTLLTYFNAIRATKNLGNMPVAGALQFPQAFVCMSISIQILRLAVLGTTAVATAANDLALLVDNGWAEFTVGQKNYGTWPMRMLPGGNGISAELAAAGAEAADEVFSYASNGVPDIRAVYTFSRPLMIPPQVSFNLTLNWAAAQTLTSDVAIRINLDGELFRPVQ